MHSAFIVKKGNEMLGNFVMRDEGITVVLGTSMTINVNPVTLNDYGTYLLLIGEKLPANEGIEQVFIAITQGTVTTTYPLIDNAGNVVVAGKLRGGRMGFNCDIESSKYRLQYGSNGLPSAIPHFIVHAGLCPMIFNGTSGATTEPPVV